MDNKLVTAIRSTIKNLKTISASRQTASLKKAYDKQVGLTATKHHTHDSTFYICRDLFLGYRTVKFFNDSTDYRIGAYHPSPSEAYSDALCWM